MVQTFARLTGFSALAIALALPLAAQALRETLDRAEGLEAFSTAIDAAGMEIQGPATIFAPTDEAFRNLPAALRDRVDDVPGALGDLLALHVVPGKAHAADDLPVEMQTRSGTRLLVTYSEGALTLRLAQPEGTEDPEAVLAARAANEARVVAGNLTAGDVTIHAIDAVLIPLDLDQDLDRKEATASPRTEAPAESGSLSPSDDYAEQIAATDDGPTPELTPPDGGAAQREEDVAEAAEEPAQGPDAGAGRVVTIPSIILRPEEDAASAEQSLSAGAEPARQDAQAAEDAPREGRAREPAVDLAAATISVTDLLDRPVRDETGEDVGTVADVTLSLDTAQLQSLVILTERGFLGLGEDERREVDIEDISIDPLDGAVVVSGEALSTQDGGE